MSDIEKSAMLKISDLNYKFTDKQIAFIHEVLIGSSLLAAYRKAFNPPSKNDDTIKARALRLVKQPIIMEAIRIVRHNALLVINEKFMSVTIDAAWVLHRAALLADFNIRKFIRVDPQGNAVYDFTNATDDDWYCIAEYTVDEIAKGSGENSFFVDRVKLKTVDKLRALELVGKHISVQAFKEQIDLSSRDGSMTPVGIDASKLSNTTLAELLSARVVKDDSATDPDE